MVYMISYDLHSDQEIRDKIIEDIESIGGWCHYLTTTYLVATDKDIYAVEDKATSHLENSDRMIICKVEKPIRGWLAEDQWKWIKENL